ncbi:MAG: Ca-activated chloride channel family protein [Oceanicoccus sp.]|jgi:Ca-activated chloride channel family protein
MFNLKRGPHPVFIEDEKYLANPHRRLRLRFVLLLLMVLIGSWAWHSASAERNTDAGGRLMATDSEGAALTNAFANINNNVTINVSGMVAHVSVQQSFKNTHDDWLQAVYVFPLPDKAAVHRMRIKIGDRIIDGSIREKAEAKAIFQQAKAKGKKAALVDQHRPNLFKTTVANIPPGETITVELDYIDKVAYQQDQFALRYPLAITRRYSPVPFPYSEHPYSEHQTLDQESVDHQAMDALMIDHFGWSVATALPTPVNKATVALTVELDAGLPLKNINSAHHGIDITQQNNIYAISLDNSVAALEQDFVLRWQPQSGQAPTAALFKERVEGEEYLQLMLLPPQGLLTENYLPREVIYVIDTSGSMQGRSIIQAKKSLLLALEQLNDQDSFNIIRFSNTTQQIFSHAMPATADNIRQANAFVNALQANGGTEMMPALQAALRDPHDGENVRQIIFITDGAVGNETQLFKAIHQGLGRSRLFTIGIGSAPNSYFMRQAAAFGRGSFTHIGNVSQVQDVMSRLLSKLNRPVMSDITIDWPAASEVEQYPQKIPDLYADEPVLVNVAIKQLPKQLIVRGKQGPQQWQKTITVDSKANHKGIATLWAREKIQYLEDEKIKGRAEPEVRLAILAVALKHQLMSAYTSFVAVEKVQQQEHESGQDQPPPVKTSAQHKLRAILIPQTATRATWSLFWGSCLLIFFAVLKFSVAKEQQYEQELENERGQ